jgi:hypothetical protein
MDNENEDDDQVDVGNLVAPSDRGDSAICIHANKMYYEQRTEPDDSGDRRVRWQQTDRRGPNVLAPEPSSRQAQIQTIHSNYKTTFFT